MEPHNSGAAWEQDVMSNSTIRAALDDGPRVGEVLEVETGAGEAPPTTLVVSDPFSEGPGESTTYHLLQEGTEPGSYIYRTGKPDSSDEQEEPDEPDEPDDAQPSGEASEQLQKERMASEGGV
jgi:hypothetical protein